MDIEDFKEKLSYYEDFRREIWILIKRFEECEELVNYPFLTEGACSSKLLRGWLTFSPTQSDIPTGKVGYKPLLFQKKECLCHTHRILRSAGLFVSNLIFSKNSISIATNLTKVKKGGWLFSPPLRKGSPSQKER